MSFYSNFLRLCNERNVTPSRVMLDCGGTKSAVTRWKNGGLPTDATLQRLADYFGVEPDALLAPDAAPSVDSDNPDIQLIARAGSKMTPAQAAKLRQIAEVMFPEAFK